MGFQLDFGVAGVLVAPVADCCGAGVRDLSWCADLETDGWLPIVGMAEPEMRILRATRRGVTDRAAARGFCEMRMASAWMLRSAAVWNPELDLGCREPLDDLHGATTVGACPHGGSRLGQCGARSAI